MFASFSGEYMVNVFYFGKQVPVSPITAHAWDISKVDVSSIDMAYVGLKSQFTGEYSTLVKQKYSQNTSKTSWIMIAISKEPALAAKKW